MTHSSLKLENINFSKTFRGSLFEGKDKINDMIGEDGRTTPPEDKTAVGSFPVCLFK